MEVGYLYSGKEENERDRGGFIFKEICGSHKGNVSQVGHFG